MLLSIIIVNYNSTAYLSACLTSIDTWVRKVNHEVIVVDNGSADNCRTAITRAFPNVIFIEAGSNLGFAKANNLGARHSGGDYLLFLNPDTEILGDAVETMLADLAACDNGGIMGCRLLNSDMSVQTSAIHRFPTIANQIFSSEFLRTRFPRLPFWGIGPLFENVSRPVAVEAVSGACMLVRRAAFTAAGGFNEEFFMYAEDIDLCHMIRSKGFGVYYTGKASVLHYGGASSSSDELKRGSVFRMKEAIYILLRRRRGTVYAQAYRAAIAAASVVRIVLLAAAFPFAAAAGYRRAVVWSIVKWEHVLAWSFSGENRVNPSISR